MFRGRLTEGRMILAHEIEVRILSPKPILFLRFSARSLAVSGTCFGNKTTEVRIFPRRPTFLYRRSPIWQRRLS